MQIDLKVPIFAALDVDSQQQALHIAGQVSEFVGGFKVGPRLCIKYGEALIQELAALAPVFVDNKYYDIPNTMEASVRASFSAGASVCTIHGGCGIEALKRMKALEQELQQLRPFQILCVTVLTSFSDEGRPAHWSSVSLEDQVQLLAEQTQSAGLGGLVCSASEVASMRKLFPDSYLVTPGIRLDTPVANDDQKRVMTPRQALDEGASALVIGRPIYQAQDPRQAAREIFESL